MGRHQATSILALLLSMATGCATFAGDRLSDISPEPPSNPPAIEHTIGDFSFHLDGGKMITSNKAGRNLNREILRRWENSGYIASHDYVKSGEFSGKADYNLTLEGHQEGESNVALQVISGLTLFVFPYWVHQDHDVRYVLEHVETGRKFEATASDRYTSAISLVLTPVSPFLLGGAMRTWERLGNHLYQDLAAQGAFDPSGWSEDEFAPERPAEETDEEATPSDRASDPEGSAGEAAFRLRRLEQLRADGLISEEEYARKRNEILDEL